jgi:hypothetical protein
MSFAMTKAEREAFLADLHVGILCVNEANRGPLAVPIWYWYVPGGDIFIVTGEASRKAKALAAAGRATFTVQTEAPPYKYTTIEGPVTLAKPDFERDMRAVAIRYLGPAGGEAYLKSTGATGRGSVLVRIRPERWLTVDYEKQFGRA